jgi:uncharacterized protein (TIGR02453 family)
MDFKNLFSFLDDLSKNNSKEWMDDNRKTYTNVRDAYIEWLNEMDIKLAEVDNNYYATTGKKAINRINNNLLYHPNKPTYKDHFGAGLDKRPKTSDFYIHLGINECFLAGGFYRPKSDLLKSIRDAIDYNGDVLKGIIEKPTFQDYFGGLMEDEKLKTSPKGYSQDHEHIELLRHKSFAAHRPITKTQVKGKKFDEIVIETYQAMLEFRRYLNKAVSV